MKNSKIRIAIVAHNLRSAGGISVSTNIITSLLRLHPEWGYLVLAPDLPEFHAIAPTQLTTVEYFRHSSYLQRIIFDEAHLPRRLRAYRPDLILSLGNIPVRGVKARQAVLLHNANLFYPEVRIPNQPIAIQLAYKATEIQLRRGLDDVDVFLCQTETMRQRFLKRNPGARATLIMPNAISGSVPTAESAGTTKLPLQPNRSFRLLVLSRYYAHKNIEAIVECFDKHRRELQDVGVIITVAIDQHRNVASLLADIRHKGLEDAIINVGPLTQAELPAYYKSVDAVLLPTLLESLSGTYIEAMTFKKPIITSDMDFARETCGDAAIYFDPRSPDAMAESILRLKTDRELRDSLVAAGIRQRLGLLRTWDQVVAGTLTEIWQLLGPPEQP